MGKYDSLGEYLRTRKEDVWRASLREIERVVGFSLPESARKREAWWANEKNPAPSSYKRAWLDAGWKTEAVNVRAGAVTFRRVGSSRQVTKAVTLKSPKAIVPKSSDAVQANQAHTPWHSPGEGVVYLVSCVAGKRETASPACSLYTSAWFRKVRGFVERMGGDWFILSAKYGVVLPERVIEPYEHTLNQMGVVERRQWGERVVKQLAGILIPGREVVVLAGHRYREFVVPELRRRGFKVSIPLGRLKIGEQLAWLDRNAPRILDQAKHSPTTEPLSNRTRREVHGETARLTHLERFYEILSTLEARLGGTRCLADCSGRMVWPERGVYFFFQSGERRKDSGDGPRVVRVGTHALTDDSKTSLWNRLSNHRGNPRSGGGNHRSSIFRQLVGQGLIQREELDVPSWGIGGDRGQAAHRLGIDREAVKALEHPVEQRVTQLIGSMPFLWLEIDDVPSPNSLRGVVETNTIGLLSNFDKPSLDPPSGHWLGFHTSRERVRRSGLWNSNHVNEVYDPGFLDLMERLVENTSYPAER